MKIYQVVYRKGPRCVKRTVMITLDVDRANRKSRSLSGLVQIREWDEKGHLIYVGLEHINTTDETYET